MIKFKEFINEAAEPLNVLFKELAKNNGVKFPTVTVNGDTLFKEFKKGSEQDARNEFLTKFYFGSGMNISTFDKDGISVSNSTESISIKGLDITVTFKLVMKMQSKMECTSSVTLDKITFNGSNLSIEGALSIITGKPVKGSKISATGKNFIKETGLTIISSTKGSYDDASNITVAEDEKAIKLALKSAGSDAELDDGKWVGYLKSGKGMIGYEFKDSEIKVYKA